ncbi:MAG: threonylcarbamoyl-AMP synthase [Ruminococcaceae bacterium]|nr:threonylcarbamoyl-AMP synthase [Oscillospiraceae bacterium]
MKTLYLKEQDTNSIKTAAEILKNGGLVAIPTETVYGLAANALDGDAVKKIFIAKGRPQDNPLIVHVSSLSEIEPLVESVDPRVYALAEKYWPGPLTVIMKKSALIPDEVSAGLETVAIRMPSHDGARKIISASGLPLAAPSANASGKPSPTKASHVIEDLDGKIDAVVDGGECSVGVESTVVTLVTTPPTLLRPGGITPEQLEDVLGSIQISPAVFEKLREGEKAESPGMKYKHYAPSAQVTIVKGSFENYKKFVLAQKGTVCAVCFEGEGKNFEKYIEYGKENDDISQAHHIFDALREVDAMGCESAFVRCPLSSGVGLAVYNRLLRSAAFRVIDLEFSIPVIGLTGQTGSGKTTVADILKNKGYHIVDTDILARKAVENPEVIALLTKRFGVDIINDGILDRRELARRAFASKDGTAALSAITHPEITRLAVEEIHTAEKCGAKAAVIDAALLFDSPLVAICEKNISVIADEKLRLERIMNRDSLSEKDALLRMGAQPPAEYYTEKADIIIDNNGLDLNGQLADF